jgi:nucleotide-binding universal stress UspA family protein
MSTIVLGYDGSASANAALAKTIAVAKMTKSKVIVTFGYYISPLGGGDVADFRAEVEKVGNHALNRAVADLEMEGIETSTRIESGKPADVLIAVAKEVGAGVIVVGTVGESPISGALLGSVVLRLVQRSPMPVLVVPTDEA